MTKFHKAIIKLNSEYEDVQELIKINNLQINKPLTVVLQKYDTSWRMAKDLNNLKWLDGVRYFALNSYWQEFEIILLGKELTKTEVGELLHGKVLPSNN